MSRRKDDNILELFVWLPWWVDAALAALIYLAAEFILPNWKLNAPFLGDAPKAVAPLGKVLSLVPLIAAPFAYWRQRRDKQLLENHDSLKAIQALSWKEFERLVGEYYQQEGFAVEETGGGGADGGVDLVLRKDGQRFLVQCKHWREHLVGVSIIRELNGVVAAEKASGGFVITSGVFSKDAEEFAARNSIELIGGLALESMIRTARQSSQVNSPSPSTTSSPREDTGQAPLCPKCGKRMVLRTAHKGLRPGSKFWGCSGYPACTGIVNLG